MVMDDIAQKAWGFWGKAKNQIEETVATMKAMEDKPQSASELGIVPWENIPEKWADKEEDWIKLVKGVAGDEGYAYPFTFISEKYAKKKTNKQNLLIRLRQRTNKTREWFIKVSRNRIELRPS